MELSSESPKFAYLLKKFSVLNDNRKFRSLPQVRPKLHALAALPPEKASAVPIE
jgi:hypothetical protein